MKFAFKFSNLLGTVYRKGDLVFTKDGNSVISPVGNKITIYDLKNNKSKTLCIESSFNFEHLALSPNNSTLVGINEKGDASIISMISQTVIHTHRFNRSVNFVTFTPDGLHLIVAKENTVFVFKAPGLYNGEYVQFHLARVYENTAEEAVHLAISDDSNIIAVGYRDGSVRLHGINKFKNFFIYSFSSHSDSIKCLAFEAKSLDLISVSRDGTLCVWESNIEPSDLVPFTNEAPPQNKKKKKSKSSGGDEEESEDEENEKEENKEKDEDGVRGEESDIEGEEGEEVDYDSEENEVAKKVGDFFEAEAELSESEWGSADEDEDDEMDKMEQEEADNEYHDTDKLKEELGKIHMRQQMDDDNREVKLLQEMLLEDGELHSEGPGRQRQFKWSNLDDNSDLRMTAQLSGDSEPEDENGEEKQEDEAWRKARLDRELFLESQKDKLELQESIEEDTVNSSELTKTVILNDLKTKPVAVRTEPKLSANTGLPTKSPDSKLHALMGLHKKRGSYLSRGNQSLVRLAKITQGVGDEDSKIVKKKGNFVFSAVDPEPVMGIGSTNGTEQELTPKPDNKVIVKRKKTLATPPLLKKLKLNDGSKSSVLSKLMTSSDF
uniref:Periodic tryptophan protein 2 homolog n=2 Tax=Cacopsylla melanoneura TaxID=428564 RepID=A0A8D8ZYI4_9HEMI